MNKLKNFLRFVFNIEYIIIAFIALGLLSVGCLIVVNISFLNPISESVREFSITDVFYEIENSQNTQETSPLISIVDITDIHAREDIGEVFVNIAMCEPKVLGVDLIFEGVKDNLAGNEILKESVTMLPENTIFAAKLIDYDSSAKEFTSVVRSFFAEELGVKEGFVNLCDNFAGAKIREMSTQQVLLGKHYDSFAVRLCELCGINVGDKGPEQNRLINYKNVDFVTIPADSVLDYSQYLKDRIVLLGTMREEADMHSTPVGKMPGIKIFAYKLLTLLEQQKVMDAGGWMLVAIAILYCWILEVCICGIYIYMRKKKNGLCRLLSDTDLIRDIIIISSLLFLYWLLFVLFVTYNIIVEGMVVFGCIAMLPTAIDIYDKIVNLLYDRYKWEWLRRFSKFIL